MCVQIYRKNELGLWPVQSMIVAFYLFVFDWGCGTEIPLMQHRRPDSASEALIGRVSLAGFPSLSVQGTFLNVFHLPALISDTSNDTYNLPDFNAQP